MIVILPGWGIPKDCYNPLMVALQAIDEVRLIELPKEQSRLESAMAELAIPAHAHVIGHSLGGNWALYLGQLLPLKSIFCVTTNPSFIEQADWNGMSHDAFENLESSIAQQAERALKMFYRTCAHGEPKQTLKLLLQRADQVLFSDTEQGQMANKQTLLNRLEHLRQLKMHAILTKPSLVKTGFWFAMQDALVPIAIADQIAQMPEQYVVVKRAGGHLPMMSQLDQLVEDIKTWHSQTH